MNPAHTTGMSILVGINRCRPRPALLSRRLLIISSDAAQTAVGFPRKINRRHPRIESREQAEAIQRAMSSKERRRKPARRPFYGEFVEVETKEASRSHALDSPSSETAPRATSGDESKRRARPGWVVLNCPKQGDRQAHRIQALQADPGVDPMNQDRC
jgi:hypothetical protein